MSAAKSAIAAMRAWVPPAAVRLYWRIFPRFQYLAEPGIESTTVGEGWNDERVVLEERSKWDAFRTLLDSAQPLGFSHEEPELSNVRNLYHHNVHMAFAYVVANAARKRQSLSVLDWGGGLGHYYMLARALSPDVMFDYHIRDVPRMTAVGRELLPDVHWHSDDSCLDARYDLVFINGSLQYMSGWEAFLRRAMVATQDKLFVTRVPVVCKVPTFAAIQTAYGTRMVHWQFNEAALLKLLRSTGLHLVREILVGGSPYISGAPEQPEMRGWLLER